MVSLGKFVGVYDGIIYDLFKYISNGLFIVFLVNEIFFIDIDIYFMD